MVDGTSLSKKSRRVSSYDTNCNKVAEGVVIRMPRVGDPPRGRIGRA
jgi:hypothetical protein